MLKWFFTRSAYEEDQKLGGVPRSSRWNSFRDAFLKGKVCAVCGGMKDLVAHHKKPFHIYPDLELVESNLIALCEGSGINCHLTIGHLGSFRSYNEDVEGDARVWKEKIEKRP